MSTVEDIIRSELVQLNRGVMWCGDIGEEVVILEDVVSLFSNIVRNKGMSCCHYDENKPLEKIDYECIYRYLIEQGVIDEVDSLK